MTKIFSAAEITLQGDQHQYLSSGLRPVCPRCGDTYLHQGTVYLYNRDVEDSSFGFLVEVSAATTKSTQRASMVNCPSGRRDGLSIDMDCEVCGPVGRLTIYQHKGETFIGWQK